MGNMRKYFLHFSDPDSSYKGNDMQILNLFHYKRLFFKEQFKVHNELRGRYRDFLYLPPPPYVQIPPSSTYPTRVAHFLWMINLH